MAAAVYLTLRSYARIDQDSLAACFVDFYQRDPNRGYGATVRSLLRDPSYPGEWSEMVQAVFSGMGSMGNGAAMRVGPIGAYYCDDLDLAMEMAENSAVVTHANKEAIVGAQAVAIATALATRIGRGILDLSGAAFIQEVVAKLPTSDT